MQDLRVADREGIALPLRRLPIGELSEPDLPQASEPITWRLLTSQPVANTDAAWQIVDLPAR